ncbi:MAG: 2-oxoglutarate dehydrogenase complex dihydrolipoyllysine-residue succinyltransferase [Anaerolineaceae bacterium]|nr:2-oxoglutarate dehydrogenase complex dihydrolipoyllysine-residue succinyltransferase [Anaerolineaceae bacterium]
MESKIVVPALGESIVEATVMEWFKKAGEAVKAGEPVVALETDKINVEVAAEQSGVLTQIERQAGEDVRVGDKLGMINSEAAEAPKAPSAAPTAVAAAPAASKKDDSVSAAQAAAAVKTASGLQEKITPLARRVAKDYSIDLSRVQGSGEGGRILRKDVEALAQSQPATDPVPTAASAPLAAPTAASPAEPTTPTAPTAVSTPDFPDGREERLKMSRRRRTIAQKLVETQQTAAMLTTFNDVDMSAVMKLRQLYKQAFKEKYGVSLGIVSFFVKASILALKDFPRLNAEIQGDEMVLKHYYNIGVAIGSEEGLVVPVVHQADRLTFAEIERTIQSYAKKSQDGTLALDDLRGSTFTITNGGVFGSLMSTPILNGPESAILGLHRIEDRPVVLDGQVVVRPMMYMALSYDHRMVDGREAVLFLVRIKKIIEAPETILLEL